jgi:hypothetical protein
MASKQIYLTKSIFSLGFFMLKYSENKKDNISDSKITKILSDVPNGKEFRFFTAIGQNTGESAASLLLFADKLKTISLDSVKFHFQRGDFQKWAELTLGDYVLAKEISQTSSQLFDEALREKLLETVEARIAKLKRLHGEIGTSKIWESSIKRSKNIRR